MFTKQERTRYNEDRARACARLGITVNQYNWLRRKGESLRKVYEDSCNGIIAEDAYDLRTGDLEAELADYIKPLDLHIYLQTDPRGATIYLDTLTPLTQINYNEGVCIY